VIIEYGKMCLRISAIWILEKHGHFIQCWKHKA